MENLLQKNYLIFNFLRDNKTQHHKQHNVAREFEREREKKTRKIDKSNEKKKRRSRSFACIH